MEPTRRHDDPDETQPTIAAFGGSHPGGATEREPTSDHRSPVPLPTPSDEVGTELPSLIEPGIELLNRKYRVIEKLGEGGMGTVWLVEHQELDQKRALKLIHPSYAADKQVRQRFRREAKILASIRHPNAVLVYDTGFIGQVPYIDMEYLKGDNLRRRLRNGKPMPLDWVLWIVQELQKVLDIAHAQKIVHRDLKPENLMLVDDPLGGREQLKVLDFGIAKIIHQGAEDSASITVDTHGLIGTLAYASPEQNDVDPDGGQARIDHRSDIYSVGVILFEMLTGHRPFQGAPAQLLLQHAHVAPPTFKKVAPDLELPAGVEAVVRRCLEKKADDRPNSMAEVVRELRNAVTGSKTWSPPDHEKTTTHTQEETADGRRPRLEPTQAETSGGVEITKPETTRRPLLGRILLVAASLTILVLLLVWATRRRPEKVQTEIRPEVANFLTYRKFQPVEGGEIRDGWPVSIRHLEDSARSWDLHGKVYLPKGFEPDPEKDEHGLWRVVKSSEGVSFLLIPGKTFQMGAFTRDGVFDDAEKPAHDQALSTFYMQRTETTIGEFDRFRRTFKRDEELLQTYDGVRRELEQFARGDVENYPAAGVPYQIARRYALAMGGDLPTEAQYEFAARSGGNPLRFVWGNDVGRKVNVNIDNANAQGLWKVGSAKDDTTDQGIRDLAGNVREFCRDRFVPRYRTTPYPPDFVEPTSQGEERTKYVIRGGSYETSDRDCARTTFRAAMAGNYAYAVEADEAVPDVGFRVVIEVLVTDDLEASTGSAPPKKQEGSR